MTPPNSRIVKLRSQNDPVPPHPTPALRRACSVHQRARMPGDAPPFPTCPRCRLSWAGPDVRCAHLSLKLHLYALRQLSSDVFLATEAATCRGTMQYNTIHGRTVCTMYALALRGRDHHRNDISPRRRTGTTVRVQRRRWPFPFPCQCHSCASAIWVTNPMPAVNPAVPSALWRLRTALPSHVCYRATHVGYTPFPITAPREL